MLRFVAYAFAVALAAYPAVAYVGPGPGLTMLGSLIGLVASLVVALLMVMAWPLRLYYKKRKLRKAAEKNSRMPPAP